LRPRVYSRGRGRRQTITRRPQKHRRDRVLGLLIAGVLVVVRYAAESPSLELVSLPVRDSVDCFFVPRFLGRMGCAFVMPFLLVNDRGFGELGSGW